MSDRTHKLAAARHAVGVITPTSSELLLTFGRYGITEVMLAIADQIGPCVLRVWTWTIAEQDIAAIAAQQNIANATLFVDIDSRGRVRNNPLFAQQWRNRFGADSIKYVISHAKMMTLESATHKVLIDGSANANNNIRFEQIDVSCGGPDFDLVSQISDSLANHSDDTPKSVVYSECGLGDALQNGEFKGIKPWHLVP